MFAYGVKKAIGSFVAALGDIDLLVFTGAIGEHAADVRAKVCDGLGAFGLCIDPARNAKNDDVLSVAGAPVTVLIVRTDEDFVIAKHTKSIASRQQE